MSQPVRTPSGLPFGQGRAMEGAQEQMPLPQRRGTGGGGGRRQPPPRGGPGRRGQPQIPNFAEILARPTNQPEVPGTAGLPFGPGGGPEEIAQPGPMEGAELRSMVTAASHPEMPPQIRGMGLLFQIIEQAKRARPEIVPAVSEEIFTDDDPEELDFRPLRSGTQGTPLEVTPGDLGSERPADVLPDAVQQEFPDTGEEPRATP